MISIKKIIIIFLFFTNVAWAQSICTPEQRSEANNYVAQANQRQHSIKDTPELAQQYTEEIETLITKAVTLCPNEAQLYILNLRFHPELLSTEPLNPPSASTTDTFYVVEYCTPENRRKTTERLAQIAHLVMGNIANSAEIKNVTQTEIIDSLLTEMVTICPDDRSIQILQSLLKNADIPLTKAAYNQLLQKYPPVTPEALMVLCDLQERSGEAPKVWQACYQQADNMYTAAQSPINFDRVITAMFAENPQAEALREQYLQSADPNLAFYQPFLQPADFQWQKWLKKFGLSTSIRVNYEIFDEQYFPNRKAVEDSMVDSLNAVALNILKNKHQATLATSTSDPLSICTPEQRSEANSYVVQANQRQRSIRGNPELDQQYSQEALDLAKKAVILCPNETQLYVIEPLINAELIDDKEPAQPTQSTESHLYIVEYCTPENRVKTTEQLFQTFLLMMGSIDNNNENKEVSLNEIFSFLLTEAIKHCPNDHPAQFFHDMLKNGDNVQLMKVAYSQFLQQYPPETPETLIILCSLQEKSGEAQTVWQTCYRQADKMYSEAHYPVNFVRVMAAMFAENPQADVLREQYLASNDPNVAFYRPFLQPADFQRQKWQAKFKLTVTTSIDWGIMPEQNFPNRERIAETMSEGFSLLASKVLAEKNQNQPSEQIKPTE